MGYGPLGNVKPERMKLKGRSGNGNALRNVGGQWRRTNGSKPGQ